MAFAHNDREVLKHVLQTPGFLELTRVPVLAPMEIGLVLLCYGTFAASTTLWAAGHLPLAAMMLINGCAIYAVFTPLHDATHRTVSSNRKLNDLIGTIACGLLLPGITTRIYRYLHLEHHRHAGCKERDPDEPFVSATGWRAIAVTAGLDVLWVSWYLRRWQSRPAAERREFALSIGIYVGLHVIMLASPWRTEFFLAWMLPQRLGLFLVSWFFARIQHPEDVLWEDTPFQTTVRIVCSTLGDVLMIGQTRHCLHHLAPSVPYYRYHAAWRIGRERFEAQGVPIRSLWSDELTSIEAHDDKGAPADLIGDRAFEVEIASTGEVLHVGADETLLDVLNANGHYVMSACAQGLCGSCRTPVIAGEPDHRDAVLSEEERARNDEMTVCVSRAKSTRLVLDL